jgi:uncharacterized integral membrane protein (TIGR00698 family)
MISLSPQLCLITGLIMSLHPRLPSALKIKSKATGARLLQMSIILLGASLNFSSVLGQGLQGLVVTSTSIVMVFIIGYLGMRIFHLDRTLGLLITTGTAICGGSAIAALAPVLEAEASIMAISLSITFLLNALSVFIFPPVGEILSLSQADFGLWTALAVHDTSSVVAASSLFGKEALAVATTVKLTRALWIIPLTLFFSIISKKKDRKLQIPWFIIGFAVMSFLFTFVPALDDLKSPFGWTSKQGFALTLFFIGLSFDMNKLRSIGPAPLLFGTLLWVIVSAMALAYVWVF